MIRDVSQSISNNGNALKNGLGFNDECCCQALFFDPTGKIFSCGCKEGQFLGTIDNYKIPSDFPKDFPCYNNFFDDD